MNTITIDLGKVAITLGGEWRHGQSYEALTEVVYPGDGRGYISLKDNINVTPGTDPTTWKPCVNPGKSLYELAVDHGYEGTEEEFIQEYNDAVAAAQNAATTANTKMQQFAAAEAERAAAESARAAAESARAAAAAATAAAEAARVAAESARATAETARANAEALRVQEFNTVKQQCVTAAGLASEKASLADEKAAEAEEAATTASAAASAANEAAEAAEEAAADVVTPTEVLAEHIARLEEEVKAIRESADKLGDARARSLTLDALFKVCGKDFFTEGSGAPTVAGACKFAEYYDTTNGVFYKYNGSAWKALN